MLNIICASKENMITDIDFMAWIVSIKPDAIFLGIVNILIALLIYYFVNKKQEKRTFIIRSIFNDIKDCQNELIKLTEYISQNKEVNSSKMQEYIDLIELRIIIIERYIIAKKTIIEQMKKNIKLIDENTKSNGLNETGNIATKDLTMNLLTLKDDIVRKFN
jgi:hypothetical protein